MADATLPSPETIKFLVSKDGFGLIRSLSETYQDRFPPLQYQGLLEVLRTHDAWRFAVLASVLTPEEVANSLQQSIIEVQRRVASIGSPALAATFEIAGWADTCSRGCRERCRDSEDRKKCYNDCYYHCMERGGAS